MKLTTKLMVCFLSVLLLLLLVFSLLSIDSMLSLSRISAENIESLGEYSVQEGEDIIQAEAEKMLLYITKDLAARIGDYIKIRRDDVLWVRDIEKTGDSFLMFSRHRNALIHNKSDKAPVEGVSFPNEADVLDVEGIPVFKSIRYIDMNGREIVKVENNIIKENLKDVNDELFFTETSKLANGEIYVSTREYTIWDCTTRTSTLIAEPIYTKGENCPDKGVMALDAADWERFKQGFIRYSTPMYDNGVFVGIVTADVDFLPIMKIVNDIKIADTGYAFLQQSIVGTDEYEQGEAITLAHPSHQFVLMMDPASLYQLGAPGLDDLRTLAQKQHKGEFGIGRYIFRDVDKYTSYSAFNENGIIWSVGITSPVEEFTLPIQSLSTELNEKINSTEEALKDAVDNSILGFTIMAFCLGVLFAIIIFFVARTITKPIHALHKGTEIIAKGDLDFKTNIRTKDEIGQLSKAFDYMAKELKKSKTNLEKQIVERTKQLNSKVEQLEKFQKFSVGRELKMVKLKKEIKVMEDKLGKSSK